MKNLLIILGLIALVGLGFHDKQQTTDLAAARQQNDDLTQQLSDKTAAYNGLQLKYQQLQAELSAVGGEATHAGRQPATAIPLIPSSALDKPAYRQ